MCVRQVRLLIFYDWFCHILKENKELKARLTLLCRHKVYGVWTADGCCLYAGQDTNGSKSRIQDHLKDVLKSEKISFLIIYRSLLFCLEKRLSFEVEDWIERWQNLWWSHFRQFGRAWGEWNQGSSYWLHVIFVVDCVVSLLIIQF